MEKKVSIKLRIKVLGRGYDQTDFYSDFGSFYQRLRDFVIAYAGTHSLDSDLGYLVGCLVWNFRHYHNVSFNNELIKWSIYSFIDNYLDDDEVVSETYNVYITLK